MKTMSSIVKSLIAASRRTQNKTACLTAAVKNQKRDQQTTTAARKAQMRIPGFQNAAETKQQKALIFLIAVTANKYT